MGVGEMGVGETGVGETGIPQICQGQPRVIICTNYDGQETPLLHNKFHRPTGSGVEDFLRVFTIYGRGSHLGHVTSIMSSNLHFLVLKSFHTKFGSEQHSSF